MDGLDRYEDGCLRPVQAVEDDNRVTSSSVRSIIGQEESSEHIREHDHDTADVSSVGHNLRECTQTTNLTQRQTNVRHPEYKSPIMRKETFIHPHRGNVSWPHDDSVMDIDLLVHCGLFYTGRLDLVRCFHCGIGFKDWAKEDNPVLEHIRYSPNCEYAKQTTDNTLMWSFQKQISETKALKQWHLTPPENIHHPKYQLCSERLVSFTLWPLDHPNPPQLAEAGLFYTGTADLVRCFSCSGGLREWESSADPWFEHAKRFPNCQYVIKVMGEKYVKQVQASHEHQTFPKTFYIGGCRSGVDESRAVRQIIDLGFQKSEVERAVQICKRKGISTDVEHVMNILLDNQERVEITKRQKMEVQILTKNKHSELADTESTATGIDVDEIRRENEALKKSQMCKICMESQINVAVLPCRHLEVCFMCAAAISNCPKCQGEIAGKFRLSLS